MFHEGFSLRFVYMVIYFWLGMYFWWWAIAKRNIKTKIQKCHRFQQSK